MRSKLFDARRRDARQQKVIAQRTATAELPDVSELFWESEYQRELMRRALQFMQQEFAPATWKACWETVVAGRSSQEVARELGISENDTWKALRTGVNGEVMLIPRTKLSVDVAYLPYVQFNGTDIHW